ncbi:endonuclease/exonuclease/phosphatase family protein [Mucilaginibacter glaciei]|uniref:Endonuclease/exonuclease/phosphatase family protein n=1 Tax=Mucilaginibacter glaciei TaxID=2772109 RepID=A0A926NI92_9SPHI|nr:endonuclease/exonuclease/phosphatase family protein [Mucilaginibacter glaciei]MBD1392579.1 endonuclease/exonuclease/phosphatase family protein [Mucilaginibacter glaciei]
MMLVVAAIAVLLLCFTVLSLVRHDYWTFRVFDYPRIQKFILSVVCLVVLLCYAQTLNGWLWALTAAMAVNAGYLFYLIVPFTVLGKKQVLRAGTKLPGQTISLMVANVYEDNTNASGCLKEIYRNDPDVVLLLETNKRWETQTNELGNTYAHSVKVALENTYGMLLYSKLPLQNYHVKYLVESDIPSIHTEIVLPNGMPVQLFAVHPTPPVPNENPRSTERDKELLLVADMAKASALPVIVIGDLNDVAWSYTTELFLKMSGLLDPRRGRGFFNSFHAHYPLMRFPLDHAFISTDFKLRGIRRLRNFNSDHFPIFVDLQYDARAPHQQSSMEADAEDIQEAAEKKAAI